MTDTSTIGRDSGLPQRRLHLEQPDTLHMASMLASFNEPFRPEELAESATMPLPNTIAQQPLPDLTMFPGDLYNTGSSLDITSPFGNTYGLASDTMSGAAMFGSLSWPAPGPPPLLRDSSHSSTASEPYIKMEDTPVHPSQPFYGHTAFAASPPEYSSSIDSSDDSKPTIFSTDIDNLMVGFKIVIPTVHETTN